jgi:CubicO group peptidase (beta-lactamase class C family)
VGNASRLARIAALGEPEAEPGVRYAYSNDGYVLLAEAIAGAAGAPLASVAAERIFDPLGMSDTRFRDTPDRLPARAARGHFRATDGRLHVEPARFHVVGPGGLWTTARDLALWNANLDDDRLSGGWLAERLVTPGRLRDDTELHYAWGLSIRMHRGLPLVVHGGSFPGWEAASLRFPDHGVAAVCLANAEELDVRAIAFRAADHLLAEHHVAGAPRPPARAPTERFCAVPASRTAGGAPASFRYPGSSHGPRHHVPACPGDARRRRTRGGRERLGPLRA